MSRRKLVFRWAVLCFVGALLGSASSALATFPGANGKIVFVSYESSRYVIVTEDPDGSHRTPITSGNYDKNPAASPDGTKIAFTRQSVTGGVISNRQIWVMDLNGAHAHALMADNGKEEQQPAWSSDGTKIAFTSDRGGDNDIWVVAAPGVGSPTDLTPSTPSSSESMPDWAPNGSKIAFVSDRGGNTDIYVMSPTGASPTALASNAASDTQPAWTPDSAKILFSSKRTGNQYDIYRMTAAGATVTNLTNTSAAWEQNPSPEPDGSGFVFDTDGALPTSRPAVTATDLLPHGSGNSTMIGECDYARVCAGLGGGSDPSTAQKKAETLLSIEKTADVPRLANGRYKPVQVGSEIAYTVVVRNIGGTTAKSVHLEDEFATETQVLSRTSISTTAGTCEVLTPNRHDCELGDLPAGRSAMVTYSAFVKGGGAGIVINHASAKAVDGARVQAQVNIPFDPRAKACTILDTVDPAVSGGASRRPHVINGTSGADVICGFDGNDTINGRGGNDVIYAGPGNDIVHGGPGADKLYGQDGRDQLFGEGGNDDLDGGRGVDTCSQGAGTGTQKSC